MANEPSIIELRHMFNRRARLLRFPAQLGDASGTIYVAGSPGFVWVREVVAGGNLSAPFVCRLRGTVNIQPNRAVQWGYDETDQPTVFGSDFDGVVAQGGSPLIDNPADPNIYGFVNQSQFLTLICSPTKPPSTSVRVLSWIYSDGDANFYQYGGNLLDLSGYIPTTGNHCIAGIFLKFNRVLEVQVSTTKSTSDPIGIADVTESYLKRSPGSKSVWFWRLHDAQTEITANDSWLDGRQFIAPDNPCLYDTVTTTDATVTTLSSIAVSEGEMITVRGMINGLRNDTTESIGGTFSAVFRRPTGGNVTLVGSVTTDIHEDFSGAPTFTMDADTGTQTARIRVTGEVAKTVYWWTKYEVLRS